QPRCHYASRTAQLHPPPPQRHLPPPRACQSILPDAEIFPFNNPAPPHIYTLSLHDALPISPRAAAARRREARRQPGRRVEVEIRSEEHTSELQSHLNLVCRLLLEKKKKRAHRVRHLRHWQCCDTDLGGGDDARSHR